MPKIVVAIRRMNTKAGSFVGDIRLDLQVLRNTLHMIAPFWTTFDAVRNMFVIMDWRTCGLSGIPLGQRWQ